MGKLRGLFKVIAVGFVRLAVGLLLGLLALPVLPTLAQSNLTWQGTPTAQAWNWTAANMNWNDGSIRAGGIHNNYGSFDLLPGVRATYASDSAYFGSHFGIGKFRQVGNNYSIDIYGRYFWTLQQGNTVTLSTGDEVRFAIDAPTLRGSTGVGELGVAWKPASYRGMFVDLGVQGYIGKREGTTASLCVGRIF